MKQKNIITLLTILLTAASVLMQSCGKDNLKYPSATLKGRFTYNGQPVGLIYNNTDVFDQNNNASTMFLQQTKGAQPAYGVGDIRVYAKHDGSFSIKMYDGEYLARTQASRVPFESISNFPITVNGDTDLGNIEVKPYWWMSNLVTTYNGGVLTAKFDLTKVITTGANAKNLQFVAIYLSPSNTPDVLSANSGAALSVNAGVNAGGNIVPAATSNGGAVTLTWDLKTLTTLQKQQLLSMGGNGTIWASVAVKTNQITDALYSDPIKLQLP